MVDDEPQLRRLTVPEEANGQRLDLFLTQQLREVSRSRVQLLLQQGSVLIDGKQAKASRKVRGGEDISILGDPQPPPLRAMAEAIPLEIVYEDSDLAVVNIDDEYGCIHRGKLLCGLTLVRHRHSPATSPGAA